ncbi:fimbrial protein [Dyella amyloliquefaciens]|uniref:fimbrial protein n=1 Tax=Dyella amyloliquefaciens TaxID=1770545 RepID=UPI00102ED093|nr:fimbrial protein [Dyella amyloliquefaciens]
MGLKSLIALGLLTIMPLASVAQDLTVHFTGDFFVPSCAVSIDDVDLGTYSVSDFTGVLMRTPAKVVTLKATNCSHVSVASVLFSGVADGTVSGGNNFKVTSVSGNISGVAVYLAKADGTKILPGAPSTALNWDSPVVNPSITILASFIQTTSTVTPGVGRVFVNAQFTYN